ncbi:nucleotidyltransferase-like protein [Alkalicoccus urumqiensis]|uniref:Nucleotidyltransferase-like domain-containing protein n=1 Tax=Alkalicoccus urumqiensis TaxID=1548213 RepID=A0A2P6MGT2_ALKUR|nr:nucleotidyltransferase-like protein [Alkalicoccus urumqiensis]PRO65496.1 hypothetical protein C6I21_10115 [Alkalicoccus urumqiensis]
MEEMMRALYQDKTGDADTAAVVTMERRGHDDVSTDYFDAVILIIKENGRRQWEIKHYEADGVTAAVHIVATEQIDEWLTHGTNRRAVEWMVRGRVVYDRDEFMKNYRRHLNTFPEEKRQTKIGMEFSRLVRRYADGRSLFASGHYLDAYNQIVHALHHLARLAVIEKGYYPEVTVWEQVKRLEPEIHKLYSELTSGREPLEKRLELLLLANEFEMTTKVKLGSAHLLSIMEEAEEAWSVEDLKERVSFHDYSLDITLLLEYLVQRGVLRVILKETKGRGIQHRLYKAKRVPEAED